MGKKKFFQTVISESFLISHLDKADLLKFSVKKQSQIQNKQYCSSNCGGLIPAG